MLSLIFRNFEAMTLRFIITTNWKKSKRENVAKGISAKLLVLNLNNYLDEKGEKWQEMEKQEETEKLKKKQDQRSKPRHTFFLLCWFFKSILSNFFGENVCFYENMFFMKTFLCENMFLGEITFFCENLVFLEKT